MEESQGSRRASGDLTASETRSSTAPPMAPSCSLYTLPKVTTTDRRSSDRGMWSEGAPSVAGEAAAWGDCDGEAEGMLVLQYKSEFLIPSVLPR